MRKSFVIIALLGACTTHVDAPDPPAPTEAPGRGALVLAGGGTLKGPRYTLSVQIGEGISPARAVAPAVVH